MNNQKGFVTIVLAVVAVVLVGAGGYFVFVKKSEPIIQQMPSAGHIVAFEEAINKSDMGTASSYFADTVYVTLEGSSCCGAVNASRATEILKGINGLVFTFDPNDAVVKEYKAFMASEYPNGRLVGAAPQFYFDELSIGVESDAAQQYKASIGYRALNGIITDLFINGGRDRQ
ncbi:MAG: hypothetical protein Q7R63_02500 [bacterium]|nr:hypothetical protein [bacterium]